MHLAIILDGNGRWGISHFNQRTKGHEEGARNVWRLVQNLPTDVKYLTLYGLSIDNIKKRPATEIAELYRIFKENFSSGVKTAQQNNVQLRFIGNGELPRPLLSLIHQSCKVTQNNDGLILSVALSYGGRNEIIRSVAKLQTRNEPITRYSLETNLDTGDLPDVDILVRTGGEKRLSDFLIWQCAYSELFFTDTLFPDFSSEELSQIMVDYRHRKRKFGGIV